MGGREPGKAPLKKKKKKGVGWTVPHPILPSPLFLVWKLGDCKKGTKTGAARTGSTRRPFLLKKKAGDHPPFTEWEEEFGAHPEKPEPQPN